MCKITILHSLKNSSLHSEQNLLQIARLFAFCQPSPSVDKVFPRCYNQIIIHFECCRGCLGPAENRKSGANPERYRHCMCSGPTRGESQSLGTLPRRLCAGCQSTSQETCSRRFPLLSAYIGQAGFFVREKRLRQCSYCRSRLLENARKQRRRSNKRFCRFRTSYIQIQERELS